MVIFHETKIYLLSCDPLHQTRISIFVNHYTPMIMRQKSYLTWLQLNQWLSLLWVPSHNYQRAFEPDTSTAPDLTLALPHCLQCNLDFLFFPSAYLEGDRGVSSKCTTVTPSIAMITEYLAFAFFVCSHCSCFPIVLV